MTLTLDDWLEPSPFKYYRLKDTNKALEEYADKFGDEWKDLVDSYAKLTSDQERAYATIMRGAIAKGEPLTQLEVMKANGRPRTDLDSDDINY